ncbi:MAG: hypothetical protein L3J71_09430 [Victivallaceae bacterium]|nr:hypothetical protein [Victivallaceae bacterium]
MMQAGKKIQQLKIYIAGFVMAVALSSCTTGKVSNNYLHIEDLVNHMVSQKIKVEQVQPIEPKLVSASRAFAVTIGGKEIGIYKYDVNIKKQREKIDNIEKNGRVYVLAIKFPAVVKGSFMLMGVERNPERDKIMAALESFE